MAGLHCWSGRIMHTTSCVTYKRVRRWAHRLHPAPPCGSVMVAMTPQLGCSVSLGSACGESTLLRAPPAYSATSPYGCSAGQLHCAAGGFCPPGTKGPNWCDVQVFCVWCALVYFRNSCSCAHLSALCDDSVQHRVCPSPKKGLSHVNTEWV